MSLDPSRTINGSYGEVIHEGTWLTNMYAMSAEVEISKEDIKISGSRWLGKKVSGVSGSGSMTGYKVTSELIERASSVADDRGKQFVTELISKLDDPEAYGHERIRLKNVSFDKIPLIGWEVGTIIEDEWPFTFVGYEFLDPIYE